MANLAALRREVLKLRELVEAGRLGQCLCGEPLMICGHLDEEQYEEHGLPADLKCPIPGHERLVILMTTYLDPELDDCACKRCTQQRQAMVQRRAEAAERGFEVWTCLCGNCGGCRAWAEGRDPSPRPPPSLIAPTGPAAEATVDVSPPPPPRRLPSAERRALPPPCFCGRPHTDVRCDRCLCDAAHHDAVTSERRCVWCKRPPSDHWTPGHVDACGSYRGYGAVNADTCLCRRCPGFRPERPFRRELAP